MSIIKKISLATAVLSTIGVGALIAQNSMYVPIMSYRTGPFASTGIQLMDGHRDYMTYINEVEKGVNGIKIEYDECESGYNTEKGLECYEKTKSKNPLVSIPWSTGITLPVIAKSNVDKIVTYTTGYGLSAAAIGSQFAWVFNPFNTYWDGASGLLHYLAGGTDLDKLKGKKIAFIYLDSPYGKEPLELLAALSQKHGFTIVPVPVPGNAMQNQSAQWLQIRREKPDWVIMWGWGAMNAAAINEAIKTQFPMDKFLGVWWSGHDEDLAPAGEAAKGYKSISFTVTNTNYPLMDKIRKEVVDKGLSKVTNKDVLNQTFYQRGVVFSAVLVEAIRTAQGKFGKKAMNAEQVRWGFEHLKIDQKRWKELGLEGIAGNVVLSCDIHEGQTPMYIQEWDGKKFVKVSDAINPNFALVRGFQEEAAKDYVAKNKWDGRAGIKCD